MQSELFREVISALLFCHVIERAVGSGGNEAAEQCDWYARSGENGIKLFEQHAKDGWELKRYRMKSVCKRASTSQRKAQTKYFDQTALNCFVFLTFAEIFNFQ